MPLELDLDLGLDDDDEGTDELYQPIECTYCHEMINDKDNFVEFSKSNKDPYHMDCRTEYKKERKIIKSKERKSKEREEIKKRFTPLGEGVLSISKDVLNPLIQNINVQTKEIVSANETIAKKYYFKSKAEMDDLEKQLTEKVNSIEELFKVKIDPLKERIEHVEKNNTETKELIEIVSKRESPSLKAEDMTEIKETILQSDSKLSKEMVADLMQILQTEIQSMKQLDVKTEILPQANLLDEINEKLESIQEQLNNSKKFSMEDILFNSINTYYTTSNTKPFAETWLPKMRTGFMKDTGMAMDVVAFNKVWDEAIKDNLIASPYWQLKAKNMKRDEEVFASPKSRKLPTKKCFELYQKEIQEKFGVPASYFINSLFDEKGVFKKFNVNVYLKKKYAKLSKEDIIEEEKERMVQLNH